jgi:hypothetical protein
MHSDTLYRIFCKWLSLLESARHIHTLTEVQKRVRSGGQLHDDGMGH